MFTIWYEVTLCVWVCGLWLLSVVCGVMEWDAVVVLGCTWEPHKHKQGVVGVWQVMMMQDGWTPLLVASRTGSAVAVKLLLQNKANLHHKDVVCMGSVFEGWQRVLWYLSVYDVRNRMMVLVAKGCFMVYSVYDFSNWRMVLVTNELQNVVWCLVSLFLVEGCTLSKQWFYSASTCTCGNVCVVRVVLSSVFVRWSWPIEIV